MSDVAIRVEGLGKRYRIGELQRYKALRDTMTDALRGPLRAVSRLRNGRSAGDGADNMIWAVKDVSFEVERGEAVGLIGRNGAGKSTLLKMLSRITEPTEGYAEIHGRVGSLLEVGTGFHPELTGRENAYLNGAILGMRKHEIDRRFDEIVAFSEVEKFIDTPVKHYSSGMYLRLAFAVAAHLEPEILLVDEVLAVGDAAFQKKCLGKMGEVAKEGRTVLFVSHNLAAVQSLCDVGIVLNQGGVEFTGPIGQAIYHYHGLLSKNDARNVTPTRGLEAMASRIAPGDGLAFTPDGPLVAEMEFYTDHRLHRCYLNFVIEDPEGRFLVHSRTDLLDKWPSFEPGLHRVRVEVPRLGLRAGVYTLWFRLYVDTAGKTEMADSDRMMLEVNGPQVGGLLDVPCMWSWTPMETPQLSRAEGSR